MPHIRWYIVAVAVVLQLGAIAVMIRVLPSDEAAAPSTILAPRQSRTQIKPRLQTNQHTQRSSATESMGGLWELVSEVSAHSVLVLEVETDRLHETTFIAQQLVEPIKNRYVEALVYFYQPGSSRTFASKRVQWTQKSGYTATTFPEH